MNPTRPASQDWEPFLLREDGRTPWCDNPEDEQKLYHSLLADGVFDHEHATLPPADPDNPPF